MKNRIQAHSLSILLLLVLVLWLWSIREKKTTQWTTTDPEPISLAASPYLPSGKLLFPVRGGTPDQLLRSFDHQHPAVTIAAPVGSAVLAARPGRILRIWQDTERGEQLLLQTDEGQRLHYAYLDHILVRSGQEVTAGRLLGTVGRTGYDNLGTTGLFLQVLDANDQPVDPTRLWQEVVLP